MRKLMAATVALAAVMLGGVAFSPVAGAQEEPECETILEIAAGNPDFSTLVTAVTEAGLIDALSGDGPFTVFAPTNAAFDALPDGTLDALLADPSGALTQVLLLHVISGSVDSEAAIAAAGTNVETLGGPVAVALDGETLTVGGAPVVATDIEACNGIIHVISSVITEAATVEEPPAGGGETPPAGGPEGEAAPTGDTGAVPQPTRVNTGDSGLAASAGANGVLLALLAGVGVLGIATSATALARARRED